MADALVPRVAAARQVNNPLTLIGIFAGIAEVAGTTVLPFVEPAVQSVFVWFVMLFPVLLVVLFFITLWTKPHVLYAPTDWQDEANFVEMLRGSAGERSDDVQKLKDFWKPGGTVDPANEKALRQWMTVNRVATDSITFFLQSGDFRAERAKAVEGLGL